MTELKKLEHIIGQPGAVCNPSGGVDFSIYSANATSIELCLFDPAGQTELRRIGLQAPVDKQTGLWHIHVPEAAPGTVYGYRVDGPFDPRNGHRFNKNKLLLDPYAKKSLGRIIHHQALFGYNWTVDGQKGDPNNSDHVNNEDSAPYMMKAVVIAPSEPKKRLSNALPTSWPRSVIYEAHVIGFSIQNPDVPEQHRGFFAGMAADASIRHFKDLGVTAVELMPVHQAVDDGHLLEKGLSNYWRYNTINFFLPDSKYMSGKDPGEFENMVARLDEAGIETILDVVYNHTAEGNEYGPILSFKGIDNASYYALKADDKRIYNNDNGTGNVFNANHPAGTRLIGDSMQHWIGKGVTGFRFDLMANMGRDPAHGYAYNPKAPVFHVIHEISKGRDPFDVIPVEVEDQIKLMGRPIEGAPPVKIMGEPWDTGPGGVQVGNLAGFNEWNNKFKEVRDYWLHGAPANIMAAGLSGNADVYNNDAKSPGFTRVPGTYGRQEGVSRNHPEWVDRPAWRPRAVKRIVELTTHDGMTLADLVCYDGKDNSANLEDGPSGPDDKSKNCGIFSLRHIYNMVVTASLAHGPLLIRMGDEMGQTQRGNNNAYCQDNEISWLNWKNMKPGTEGARIFGLWKHMLDLRRETAAFGSRLFMHGRKKGIDGSQDLTWYSCNGQQRRPEEWNDESDLCFGYRLDNGPFHKKGGLLAVFNACTGGDAAFTLPEAKGVWVYDVNTSMPVPQAQNGGFSVHRPGEIVTVPNRGAVVFRLKAG